MNDLVTGTHPLLRYAGTAASARPDSTHPVRRVELCDEQGRLPPGGRSPDLLAIAPGNGDRFTVPYAVMRRLAERGVVALSLTPERADTPLPATVVAEAHRLGLTLLVPSDAPSDARTLRENLLARQVGALQAAADRRARLVDLADRLGRQGEGPDKLVQALADECGAHAVMLTGPGHPTWRLLAEQNESALDRIRSGQVQVESATLPGTGEHLVLCAVGIAAPHHVLAAMRPTPWHPDLRDLVQEAASMAHRLKHSLDLQAADDRFQESREESLAAARQSVFQLLMTGHDAQAVRVAAPYKPHDLPADLLTGDTARVAVLECAKDETRTKVASEVANAMDSRALIVQCPLEDRHLVIITAQVPGAPELPKALLPVVDKPGRAVGVSSPVSWPDTSIGYNDARRCLTAARRRTPRLSVDGGSASVALLLPPESVYWAHALLRRLDDRLPARHRETVVHTTRLTLNYGPDEPKKLGYDPSKISRHLKAVMDAAGLDGGRFADRALLHLALLIEETREMPTNEEAAAAGTPPALATLLAYESAVSAANHSLGAADAEAIDLLATWIACNGQIVKTAEVRGVSRKRIRTELDTVGAALLRGLTPVGGDAYEVYWAMVLSGSLPDHTVPDPVSPVSV